MSTNASRREAPELELGINASYPELSLSLIDRDPGQPRQDFDVEELKKLKKSIETNTLLQAVTVRHHPKAKGRYMIIAGERRFRAMKLAGFEKAVFKLVEGPGLARSYILSAIENIHRVSLNPIEEATCYQKLHDEEHLSWDDISELMGVDVSRMLTKIKLLTLPGEIQEMVRKGDLPQVTALNLSQWKNETGDYLRMAHDLIAGRNPAEVHFHDQTVRGEQRVQERLPKTTEDFAARIVKLAGHVQSMPAVLEAFIRFPQAEQAKILGAIHPSVLGKLRVRFVALYRATQAFSETMENFESAKHGKKGQTSTTSRVEADEKSEKADEDPPLPPLPPPPASPPSPSRAPEAFQDAQGLDISYAVLSALFYSNNAPRVNLSQSRLQNVVPNCTDPSVFAHNAIESARARWRAAPKGDETERKFTRLVSQFRYDYGREALSIDDALKTAMKRDKSSDPVSI